jgi:hypothetical protein
MKIFFLIIILSTTTTVKSLENIKQIEFEVKIDNFLLNNNNKNLYIATSTQILILDKNLQQLQSTINQTSCLTTIKSQNINIFDINYNTNTLLECSTNLNSPCRIRNLTNLNCIYDQNANTNDFKQFHIKKALSLGPVQNNYLINKKNYLYIMPTLKNLESNGDYDDLKLFYIFSLDSTQLFQSVIILNNAFDIESETFVNSKQNLNVIYSFEFKNYIYYLYVLYERGQRITKLLRFCDINGNLPLGNLRSSELQLKCNQNSMEYNEAVDAYFIGNRLFIIFKQTDKNTPMLCIIDLNDVNQYFMKYIFSCLQTNGVSSVQQDVFMCKNDFQPVVDSLCDCDGQSKVQLSNFNDDTFCSSTFDGFINVKKALYSTTINNLNLDYDEIIIKIHSAFINSLQVLFLITNKLNLHAYKLIKSDLSKFLQLDLVPNHKNDIVNNIVYNDADSLLYIGLNRKILKVNLSNCSSYKTCSTCLNSDNPYCGWCLFGNKCTSRSECQTGSWLFNTNSSTCPFIKNIIYNDKKYLNGSQIYLSPLNNNLLKLSVSFKIENYYKFVCLLVDREIIVQEVEASIDGNLVVCEFSAKNDLNEKSNDLSLSISFKIPQTNEIISFSDGKMFKFIYINCLNRVTCSKCLNENLCKWDSVNLKCIASINSKVEAIDGIINDKEKCLKYNIIKINENFTYNQQILTNSSFIQFEIVNLNTNFLNLYSISCKFNETYQTDASLLSSKNVTQAIFQCSYLPFLDKQISSKQIEQQIVYLNIVAISKINNYKNLIDNLNEIKLNIVNCELAATNCGYCLQNYLLDINCGWCLTSSKCTTRENCASNRLDWLSKLDNNEYADCPSPVITNIQPKCGPVSGGTQLSIYGVNLGHSSNDINVFLYQKSDYLIRCELNATLYIKSSKIICTLKNIGVKFSPNSIFDLLININTSKYSKNITTIDNSNDDGLKYELILPVIYSIMPSKSISSGGTKIKLFGSNLNCGSVKQIYFGDRKCELVLSDDEKR